MYVGKFYLGDAGLMLKHQILTPYHGVLYHLKEYSARGPQNPKELFNLRHSSLRDAIERTFGVIKKRLPIIASGSEPHYGFETMRNIVLACCILRNFLRSIDNDESLLEEVDHELDQGKRIDPKCNNMMMIIDLEQILEIALQMKFGMNMNTNLCFFF